MEGAVIERLRCLLTRLKAVVDLVCGGLVASKPDNGELSLNHTCVPRFMGQLSDAILAQSACMRTRLNLRHPDRRVDDLAQERASERTHGVLGCTVDATPSIRLAS